MVNNEDLGSHKSLDELLYTVTQETIEQETIEKLRQENFQLKLEVEKVELRVLRNFEKMALDFRAQIKELKEINIELIEKYGLKTN